MIAVPFGVTKDRYEAVDITSPVTIDSHAIIYKYPSLDTDIAGFVKPFNVDVKTYIETQCYASSDLCLN